MELFCQATRDNVLCGHLSGVGGGAAVAWTDVPKGCLHEEASEPEVPRHLWSIDLFGGPSFFPLRRFLGAVTNRQALVVDHVKSSLTSN